MTKALGGTRGGRAASPSTERRRREATVRRELDALTTAATNDWARHGVCAGAGDDGWFPDAEPGTALHGRQTAEAKRACAACPVRAACLAHALATGEDAGVWGGLDEEERRALRRTEIERRPVAGDDAETPDERPDERPDEGPTDPLPAAA